MGIARVMGDGQWVMEMQVPNILNSAYDP